MMMTETKAQGKKGKTKIFKNKDCKLPENGIIKLNCLQNNTRVDITDINGNVLIWKTAVSVGYKNSKSGTPLAAAAVAQFAAEEAALRGVKTCDLHVKGIGSGRSAAIKKIMESKVNISQIKYILKLAHNGCRLKKARRG